MTFSCELVVNNLKERKNFPDQMNRNGLDLIFARHDWNCSAMKNIRYHNSTVKEVILLNSLQVQEGFFLAKK